ncbi:MAG: type II secretion system F family protein [Rickettsiales bacterium]|jgi:type II secretory pathway component PulF|nr:type II secretion system F family protein [Rickettsiales bacterium]
MANKLERLYAKMMFRSLTEKRMSSCRKMGSLLRNNFTLMDALGRLERIESKGGTKPDEPFAIVFREWQKNLERGMPFHEATRGWVSMTETLLLTLGDVSKLSVALENIGRVIEGTEKIKRSMFSAVAYPLFLLALTFGIIIMVGLYLVPPLAEAAATDIVWRGTAASLVWLSDFAARYWFVFVIGFLAVALMIWVSLSNWSGRLRAIFDKLPPWNMYKIQMSVGWLMSLSSMVAAGGTIPVVLRMLADNSNKYLRDILERALGYIANGDNLGIALLNTDRDFPNEEIIGDLAIYSDMNGFDENLMKIANDYLDESIRKMDAISNTLNSIGILLVSVIIGWVVFGTFQMQDQITAVLT